MKCNLVEFYLEDLVSKFKKIDPKKYYLAYSGGKDSHFIYWFLKVFLKEKYPDLYEEYKNIPVVSVNTYLEFPEISNRMITNSNIVLTPSIKPHDVIRKYGMPCFSKNHDEMINRYQSGNHSESVMMYINGTRNDGHTMYKLNDKARKLLLDSKLPNISSKCCYYLKKKPFKEYEKISNRKAILGIMSDESILRKAKYTSCFQKNGKFTPIHDCSEELMNQIYRVYQIELPDIYKYVNQTGCSGCPYGIGLKHTELELSLMTKQKKKYVLSLFEQAYRIRGLNIDQLSINDFI